MWIKQSSSTTVILGPFVDAIDGRSPETGLTIAQADIRLSKNSGTFAQTNNSAGATHNENGYYNIPLNATDTNTLGRLRIAVDKAEALPVWQDFIVVPANVYDGLVSGSDKLDVNTVELAGVQQTGNDIGADIEAILSDTGTDGVKIASGEVLGLVIEGGLTLQQFLQAIIAVLAGKVSGGGTSTITYRDIDDAVDRVKFTVDGSGNRTSVTFDFMPPIS